MRIPVAAISFIITILLICMNDTCYAHPHVFIDCSIRLEFRGGKLTGIVQRWSFDEMFSDMVIRDYDKNGNQQIDGDEIKALEKEYFSPLAPFSFFTQIYAGNKKLTFKTASNFTPRVEDGKLIYDFKLDAGGIPIPPQGLIVAVFDDTYYNSLEITDADFAGAAPGGLQLKTGPFNQVSYYFGQVHPEAVMVSKTK